MPQQLPECRGTRNFQSGVSCLDIRASCLSTNLQIIFDNGIHSVSSAARAKRDSIPSSGLSGDAIVIVVLEDVTCLARRFTAFHGRWTRTDWTTGEDELERGGEGGRREKESRIYTCDYEIVAVASPSMTAIACSVTLVAVAGIDLAIEYNCSTMSTTMLTRPKARIRRRPAELDKATKRIVVKVGESRSSMSPPPPLYPSSFRIRSVSGHGDM
ncbi:hypothetical protein ALC56_05014 [Trachymyrmex septentrionalis]|uniref:Uncharacterized protein n=1 Tax=Trachymyrmex septentrionalis TaxID=34720 RepID=A0A195FJX8_9HYME|nr:hypothetical protein ALC56_05014 [Trachymyrmex septentrionalis]